MIASVVIVGVSVAMLLVWLRYTLMLLRNGDRDFALNVIREHDLKFRDLNVDCTAIQIEATLRRDIAILDSLVGHVLPAYGFEILLLRVDFAVMRLWWKLTHSRWHNSAAFALAGMHSNLDTRAGIIGLAQANQ